MMIWWMTLNHNKAQEKRVKVQITATSLSWSTYTDLTTTVTLPSQRLLQSEVTLDDHATTGNVCVHYVKVILHKKNVTLKKETVQFCGCADDCRELTKQIQRLVDTQEAHRPKRLLVFINPGSGSKTNVTIYDSIAKPLFRLCGVSADVIVTTHADHPIELLASYDLSAVDAVVSMGGDGSVSLVARGLLSRTMADAGIKLDEDHKLVKPSVPLAVICGGSGNAIAMAMYSSYDVESSVLSIILGKRIPSDVMTVHRDSTWLASCLLINCIGVFNNAMNFVEKLRWLLGKSRYFFVLPAMLWNWVAFDIQVDYIPALDSSFEASDGLDIQDGPKPGWKTLRLKAKMIQLIPWKLRNFIMYTFNPKYHRPDVSSDRMSLRIMPDVSVVQFLKLVMRWVDPGEIFKIIPVTECRIHSDSPWDSTGDVHLTACDGEMVQLGTEADYTTRLHTDRLDLIAINEDLVSEAKFYASDA